MTMDSFPFDSLVVEMGEDGFPVYDRAYAADDLAETYEPFFSNGIFINSDEALKVTAGNGFILTCGFGKCHINGRFGYIKKERELLTIEAPDSQPRIDTVVYRLNKNRSARYILPFVLKGTPSANPVRPTLTRTANVWELGACDVLVRPGATSIAQTDIIDTRLETARCGMVVPFAELDTTSLFDRMDAALEAAIRKHEAQADAQMEKLDRELDRLITLSNKVTDSTNTGCGCYEELQEVRQLLYAFLDSQVERHYYFLGKSIFIPSGWGEIDGTDVKLLRNAEFDGDNLVLS